MATWFLSKIRFQRENEAGSLITVNEQYLFDAISYTEAEAKLFEHMAVNTPDFLLVSLTKMNITDVFVQENSHEVWFKVKINYIIFNEKTQKEMKVPTFFLINAVSIETVCTEIESILGNLSYYEIRDIVTTEIIEIIPQVGL